MGLIALAALSLTSCSNDEVASFKPQDNAIEFGTYLGRSVSTRGIVLDNYNLLDFGVFASYTGQNNWAISNGYNFMYNQLVERTAVDAAWVYTPKKYWPTTHNDKISFFAYAPYETAVNGGISVTTGKDGAGAPIITYTINENFLPQQADFVADVLMNQIKEGDGTSIDSKDRTVKFNLRHELTRLGFQAKLDRDAFGAAAAAYKTKVNIKSIKILGSELYTEGQYVFATTNEDDQRGSWTNCKSGQLDLATLLNTATPGINDLGGYVTPGILIPDTKPVTLFYATDGEPDDEPEYLFLIPNDVKGLTETGKVKLHVAYDIVTVDSSLNAGHSVTPAVKEIEFPATTLQQGVAYNFILTFGLNEIKLDATVEDWVNAGFADDVDWPKQDQ